MLGTATDGDLAMLEALGVRTVIDLRTQLEVDSFGVDRLPGTASLVRLPIPTVGADPIMVKAMESGQFPVLPDLAEINRGYVIDDAERIGDVLEMLSETANQPVVIHCLGGKDRTGVVSALLLALLGVPWATVRDDYLRSNEFYEGTLDDPQNSLSRAMENKLGHPPDFGDEDAKRDFFVLQPAYIDVVRDEIAKDHQTIAEFVRDRLGLSDAACERLRDGLLEGPRSVNTGLQTTEHTIETGETAR
jgi:protein-tyrosine phosphatase